MKNKDHSLEVLTSHLIKSIEGMEVKKGLFPVFTVDNILTNEIFESLRSSFPKENYQLTSTEGYFNRGTQEIDYEKLFKVNPLWEVFFSSLSDPRFISALGKKLAPHIYNDRGLRVFFPWKIKDKKNKNYEMNFKLNSDFRLDSIGKRGQINPHRDASRKLVTMMFYFADDDWEKKWGGHTVFYKPKNDKCKKIWKVKKWRHKNNVPAENLNEFNELFEENLKGEFKANSLGGMCANDYSYHAVNPIDIDESRQRRTVRLCLEIDDPYTNFIKIRKLASNIMSKILYRQYI